MATILISIEPRMMTAARLNMRSQNLTPVGYWTPSGKVFGSGSELPWSTFSIESCSCLELFESSLPSREIRLIACPSVYSASLVVEVYVAIATGWPLMESDVLCCGVLKYVQLALMRFLFPAC